MVEGTIVGVFAPMPTNLPLKSTIMTAVHPPTPPSSPPLPTPRTITELLEVRAKQLPNEPILGYPSHGIEYIEYTFKEFEAFSNHAAQRYSTNLTLRQTSDEQPRVVALLGVSNLDYLVTALALTRLGFTVLFLSTRISEAAYLSLLAATECDDVVVDSSFQKLASGLRTSRSSLVVHSIISEQDYKSQPTNNAQLPQFDLDRETTNIAWIIHSSGSTGLPKPIHQTHSAALKNYEQNMNMKGFITLPLFHAHGLSSVFRSITSIKKIYMQNASLPLTSQNLLQTMRRYQFEILYGVPYALKLLSESEEGIQELAKLKVVMFGGSACPDALGDVLVNAGVNLISHYGTTETGQLMTSTRPQSDKAWNYVRVHEKLAPFVRWEDRGASMYELCVLEGWPSKVATNREDGSYATKDLFEPHPTIAGAWKYAGRLDDTIVLMNGEKAIPIAMEQAVRQHKLVREAVMFGTGKSQLGVIVIASQLAARMLPEIIIDQLWPTIEAENRSMPGYGQLAREMIRVLPADTTFPHTDKGTVIRQAFYRTFQDEIENVYRQLEQSKAGTRVLAFDDMKAFLRSEILALSPQEDPSILSDDTDLFVLGVDSLQSTRLRARIMQEVQLSSNTLPQNVVFEYPTLTKLAQALINIRDGTQGETEDVIKQMKDLVAKYSSLPKHNPVPRTTSDRTFIVTGATGSLGAHIVAQLVSNPEISEVCCLVRAKTVESARTRVIRSMRERAVLHSLSREARRKITCYPSDLSKPDLGLEQSAYAKLCTSIIGVIHCAWSVNFNKKLSSFESDCIAGARHLMLLCLSAQSPSPASFNFCSSVSTVAATPGTDVPEEVPPFECAQGMGYAQSKMVTEHIIAAAAKEVQIPARVLRVGQIVADTTHGIWNDTEAIPLMLQSTVTIGALPALDESPRWLPVDAVASACIDISISDSTKTVYNVVNPHTFHWTETLLPVLLAAGLKFKMVGQREWVDLLRKSNSDVEVNPTFKLLDFFASKYDNDVTKRKKLEYATTNATSLSSTLSSVPALDTSLVDKFVKQFLATSWKPKSTAVSSNRRLIVIAGPCGSGKSTVASLLADRLSCPLIEGDNIHDAVAITKMAGGVALTDLDRQIWLSRIKTEILERTRAAEMVGSDQTRDFVLTCSALTRSYREALRNIVGDNSMKTVFVMLEASTEELVKRVETRKGHYMKKEMVKGQVQMMEAADVQEMDVLPVDAEKTPSEIASEVVGVL